MGTLEKQLEEEKQRVEAALSQRGSGTGKHQRPLRVIWEVFQEVFLLKDFHLAVSMRAHCTSCSSAVAWCYVVERPSWCDKTGLVQERFSFLAFR